MSRAHSRFSKAVALILAVVVFPALLFAATLGTTTQPTATTQNCENSAALTKVTAASTGTLTSLTIWMNVSVNAKDAQAAIYEYVSDTEGGLLLANSGTVVVSAAANQEITFSGFSQAIVNGTNYFIGVFCESDTGVAEIYSDNTSTGASIAQGSLTFPSWPADFADTVTTTRRYGAYGTYTVAGGGGTSKLLLGVNQ